MVWIFVDFLLFLNTFVLLTSHRILPVYDIRTDEMFAFPEDYLRLVILHQRYGDENVEHLEYDAEPLDNEGDEIS